MNTATPLPPSGEWASSFDVPVQSVSDAPNRPNGASESAPKPPARMSIVLPFIEREMPQVLRLLDHIARLSGQLNRTLYLLPFKGLDVDDIKKSARKAFADVQVITDSEGITSDWRNDDKVRDAAGPNSLFRQAAWFFHFKPGLGPWLWIEPDCVPLTATWDGQMESAYRAAVASGKSIMGVTMRWQHSPDEYLNGAAVYPQNLIAIAPAMVTRTMWTEFPEMEIGFDVAGGQAVARQAHITDLIQLDYRSAEPKPRPEAVLFHGDRSGKLLQTLSGAAPRPESGRGKMAGKTTKRPAQNISKRKRGDSCRKSTALAETASNGAAKSEPETAPTILPMDKCGVAGCSCETPPTVGDQIRAAVLTLTNLATNQNRKTRIRSALRKTNLLPKAAQKLCT